jgi:hypothetical protein
MLCSANTVAIWNLSTRACDMANRVELTGSRIVIESVCGERGGILLGLHGVRVRAEKETIFFPK